jgi:hypothetical protein
VAAPAEVDKLRLDGPPSPRMFLYAALDMSAYAAFFTESRMRRIDSNRLNRSMQTPG